MRAAVGACASAMDVAAIAAWKAGVAADQVRRLTSGSRRLAPRLEPTAQVAADPVVASIDLYRVRELHPRVATPAPDAHGGYVATTNPGLAAVQEDGIVTEQRVRPSVQSLNFAIPHVQPVLTSDRLFGRVRRIGHRSSAGGYART